MQDTAIADYTLFLLDGLILKPASALLIVNDPPTAVGITLKVHRGEALWQEAPARRGSLLELDDQAIASASNSARRQFFTELANADHWIFIPDIQTLAQSARGRSFSDDLIRAIARNEVAAVIASTRPEYLADLQRAAPRFVAFATTLQKSGPYKSDSLVAPALDRNETGWVVMVRVTLLSPAIISSLPPSDPAMRGPLALVDTARIVGGRTETDPPLGVLVSLRPDAFTVSQMESAFSTASRVAQHLLGRPLLPGEGVTPTRGIYYH